MPENPRIYLCCNTCPTAMHSTDYDMLWHLVDCHQKRYPGHYIVEEKTSLRITDNSFLLGGNNNG